MRPDDPILERLVDAVNRELDEAGVGLGSPAPSDVKRFGPYHQAAAVLATFETTTLHPAFDEDATTSRDADSVKAVDTLLADSKLVASSSPSYTQPATRLPSFPRTIPSSGTAVDAHRRERWTLRTDVRREVLRGLGNRQRIETALAANRDPGTSSDPVQEMFEAYVRGTAPPLEKQSIRQVTGTLQVVDWLEGLGLAHDLPERVAIQRRAEWLALLQLFFDLAGVDFAGRARELAQLREHVGVLPPGSIREHLSRIAASIFNLNEKPPLVIWGFGGVGKSTLVSRFIWEHATLSNTERFPWAYLDFDRPGLLAEEPLTLLIEAVRQLGIQYPDAAVFCGRIRSEWLRELSDRPPEIKRAMRRQISAEDAERVTRFIQPEDQDRYVRDFGALLRNLKVESDPFLLVLDTFERVQYRSDVVVRGLCDFLQRFQANVPRLRSVIAGRAPLTDSPFPTQNIPLGNFDEDAAVAYLSRKGVSTPEAAKRLYTQVGGNPLSLRLAAEEWMRSGNTALEGLRTRSLFGFRVEQNEVQAQLFARILNHIHNPDVRKLAYPGLVLRRITSEIIQNVLAKPCGVDVSDAATAQRLFEEMSREVGLVTFDGEALFPRPDVRRLVLRMLREREPSKVFQIEDAAVSYYAARNQVSDPTQRLSERAEEIYHRLSMRHPLDVVARRWLPGVEPHLLGAVEELRARERAWLASRLGRTLTQEERQQADLDGWERDIFRRVRDFIQQGRLEDGLANLRERGERLPGSALYALEAELCEALGRWADVRHTVERGIQSADQSGHRDTAIVLRIWGARADIQIAALSDARQKLDEAESLLEEGMTLRAIEVSLHRLALLRAEHASDEADPGARVAAAPLKRSLQLQFATVTDAEVRQESSLMAWVATEIGADYSDVLQRVVRLNGLATKTPSRLRALALAFTAIDAAQPVPGALADKAGAPSAPSLTERWTQFTRSATQTDLGTIVADLMTDTHVGTAVSPSVIRILRERARGRFVPGDVLALQEQRESAAENMGLTGETEGTRMARSSSAILRLTGRQRQELHSALLDAFPDRHALDEMVRFKLGRNLDTIAPVTDLQQVVFSLIQAAEAQAWAAQLVAAARESKPRNAKLQQFAANFGLAFELPELSDFDRFKLESAFLDVNRWREQLGVIEGQVCRVEIESHAVGTGFLVGPDLLLTASHVIERVVDHEQRPSDVIFRFDYKQLNDGATVQPGTLYGLAEKEWLVDYSGSGSYDAIIDPNKESLGPDELHYALLRLARPAGAEPVGGDRAEPSAPARRWIAVPRHVHVHRGQALFIVQHPEGRPLQVAFGSGGVVGFDKGETRIFYDVNTAAGSSGSPCFDQGWQLVAMHIAGGRRDDVNVGVSIGAVVEGLRSHGLNSVLNQVLL
jgi:hypothetical protein